MKLPSIIKDIDVDKAIKLSIIGSMLLVSFSFFYYYVIFLPQKEQAGIDRQKQEQLMKDQKEHEAKQQAEQALNTCMADAEERYSNQWYTECKSRGELTSKCISLKEMTFDEYVKQNNIAQDKRLDALIDFYKKRDECSCRLPTAIANDLGDYRDGLKAECFKRYPQK